MEETYFPPTSYLFSCFSDVIPTKKLSYTFGVYTVNIGIGTHANKMLILKNKKKNIYVIYVLEFIY